MVELLEKAFDKLTHLPVEEQERIARLILEEIEDNQRWDALFAKTRGTFSELTAQILADYQAGLTEELDPDSLPD